MVSTDEIDWVLDQLGYYIILDGGINLFPDMDNYWKIEDFFYLSPQSDEDIIIENSEADGKTWYFDTKEFKSYIDDYVDELVLESHQAYIFRNFLHNIYMPRYYENKRKREMNEEEEKDEIVLFMEWYENGKTCKPELDFPDHLQFEIRINGDLEYSFMIDNVSYDEAKKLYNNITNTDFDKIIFDII